ncbi:tyrosine-type recombinase/integrase [bacterium]|nr:tyrosine-type recombinase/integrase [bacterium]
MKNYLQLWVEHERIHRGRQPQGIDRYRRNVEMFLSWCKETGISSEASAIQRSDIDQFMKWLYFEAGNIKNSSRRSKLFALRSFFRFLVYQGIIESDPTIRIPAPKTQKGVPSKFTDEELQLLFSLPDCKSEMGVRDSAILIVLFCTGLRVSEICGLDLKDISDTGGYIRLRIRGKGGKLRILPLHKINASILRRWLLIRYKETVQPDSPVFIRVMRGIDQRGRLSMQSINKILKKYGSKIGIGSAEVFVHKMRATYAINLYDISAGRCHRCNAPRAIVNIYELMHAMGHNDANTTQAYINVSESATNKAAIPDWKMKQLGVGGV